MTKIEVVPVGGVMVSYHKRTVHNGVDSQHDNSFQSQFKARIFVLNYRLIIFIYILTNFDVLYIIQTFKFINICKTWF